MTLKQPHLTSTEIQKYIFSIKSINLQEGTKKLNNFLFLSTTIGVKNEYHGV